MKQFRPAVNWILTLMGLGITLFLFNQFVTYIETRPGSVLQDPILALFSARDATWVTFTLVYGGILVMFATLWRHKPTLRLTIYAYAIMIWIRMLMMFLLPLEPPSDAIPLNDPFVQLFGDARVLTRDLFFSGHTATLFLFSLTARNSIFKSAFLAAAILVAMCVLLQHVHYSIDVAAAPFFAYVAYRLSRSIDDRIFADTTIRMR
jgi:hypothetical protein